MIIVSILFLACKADCIDCSHQWSVLLVYYRITQGNHNSLTGMHFTIKCKLECILIPSNFKDISAERPPLPPTYTISKEIGVITKETAVLIGYLSKGLLISLDRKVIAEGIPKAIQFSYWLKKQSIILARKLVEVGAPKAIEAGRISRGLLILAVRNLKTKGVPVAIGIVQLIKDLSSQFYKKAMKDVGNKINTIKQDILTEKTKAAADADILPSSEIILKEEEAISLNERLAQEISKNGIECKAITDIGSLPIEKRSYYSHLFPLSPRVTTNRGCIRLEGNDKGNIDFIQVIQKN